MTVPVAADLAAWVLAARCEVGRTMSRRRSPCPRHPDWLVTRHDCDARPPWLSDAYICREHLAELASLPYPYVACVTCGRRFATFGHAVPDIRPIR